jgi:UDP-glucose 4-epimerase
MKFLKGVHFIEADIADRPTVESLLRELKPDGVLHFAALIEAGESMKKTRDLLPQQYRLHPFAA